jgi:hypothetical protein
MLNLRRAQLARDHTALFAGTPPQWLARDDHASLLLVDWRVAGRVTNPPTHRALFAKTSGEIIYRRVTYEAADPDLTLPIFSPGSWHVPTVQRVGGNQVLQGWDL